MEIESGPGVTPDVPSIQAVAPLEPCRVCRTVWTHYGGTCVRCRRLESVGVLVEFLTESEDWTLSDRPGTSFTVLEVLDAVADLLTEHAITARNHRRELKDTIRDAQADARDAYSRGREDERERNEQ